MPFDTPATNTHMTCKGGVFSLSALCNARLSITVPPCLELPIWCAFLAQINTLVHGLDSFSLQVVQAIGAAENNVLDFGAPKRIDGNAAIALVEAAKQVGVEQYVMVTSLGTGKFGWPAGGHAAFTRDHLYAFPRRDAYPLRD